MYVKHAGERLNKTTNPSWFHFWFDVNITSRLLVSSHRPRLFSCRFPIGPLHSFGVVLCYINYVKPFPHSDPKMAAVYITGDQSESVKVLAAIKVFSSHRFSAMTHAVPPFPPPVWFLTDFIFHVNRRFLTSYLEVKLLYLVIK